MLALALAALIMAWLLIWSAVKGVNPLDEIRAAFGR